MKQLFLWWLGEATAATRADLILPCDSAPGTDFGVPKTRGLAARHQAARLDPQDLELLTSIYADYRKDKALQAVLGLATTRSANQTPYDLGSFRPGGATFYLDSTCTCLRTRSLSGGEGGGCQCDLWRFTRGCNCHLPTTLDRKVAKERIQQLCLHFPRILVQSRWYPELQRHNL